MIQILLSLPFLQSDQRLLCNSRVAAALLMLECSTAKNHMWRGPKPSNRILSTIVSCKPLLCLIPADISGIKSSAWFLHAIAIVNMKFNPITKTKSHTGNSKKMTIVYMAQSYLETTQNNPYTPQSKDASIWAYLYTKNLETTYWYLQEILSRATKGKVTPAHKNNESK